MNLLEMYEIEEVEKQEGKPRFEITDLNSLNWAFRKLKAYKAKEKEIEEVAQNERDRIDAWEEEEKKKIQDSIKFFQGLINEYHMKLLAEDPKAKTLSTPYGKSKARTVKAQPEKADENAILQHVLNNGMDEYIKPTLKWGEFKKNLKLVEVDGKKVVVDENGQIVPGVIVKPEETKFTVEVE
jgi:Bacteriophage Mu Gam like protein.